jgi:hypothetical protein
LPTRISLHSRESRTDQSSNERGRGGEEFPEAPEESAPRRGECPVTPFPIDDCRFPIVLNGRRGGPGSQGGGQISGTHYLSQDRFRGHITGGISGGISGTHYLSHLRHRGPGSDCIPCEDTTAKSGVKRCSVPAPAWPWWRRVPRGPRGERASEGRVSSHTISD